ncbi:hypothetical protein JYU34_006515 [Plutella xylostella]|uniref:Uncharacterized protein n=1 Tax=Plutella xylostella TaxID=51655 RepID=A0ABQ7QSA7_PLUXY|nr:hypothetical protein JYU34_006515 [Plutella xylostella]
MTVKIFLIMALLMGACYSDDDESDYGLLMPWNSGTGKCSHFGMPCNTTQPCCPLLTCRRQFLPMFRKDINAKKCLP